MPAGLQPEGLERVVDRLPIDESWLFREDELWRWLDEMAGPEGPLAEYGLVSDPELAKTQAEVVAETPMGPLE